MKNSSETLDFIFNDSEAGKIARSIDWSKHPLGPVISWPQSLKTAVSLMLNSRFPMFIAWGKSRNFLYNDAYFPILGKKHPEVFGKEFQLIWSEIWTDLLPLVESVDQGKAVYLEDLKLIMNRNGFEEETYFTFSYGPIRGDTGEVLGLHCACVETTGRVTAERKLLENQERLRATFEHTSIGVKLISLEGRFLDVNHAFANMLGFSEKEILGLSVLDIIHPDDREMTSKKLRQLLCGDVSAFKTEKRFIRKNGTHFWAQSTVSVTKNNLGQPVHVVAVTEDITARKGSELSLQESQSALQVALDNAKMGAWTINLTNNKVVISDTAEAIFGIKDFLEQDVYQAIDELTHAEDREQAKQVLADAIANCTSYSHEYRILRPSGEIRWVLSQGSAIYSDDGKPTELSGIITDITERKKSDEALRESEQNFRVLFESAPGNYLVLRPDLTIAAVSDAYNEATMTKRNDILGKYIFDVFPDNPDDPVAKGLENIRGSFNFVLSSKQTHTMALQKYDVQRPDGKFEEKWWSPINYPVVGNNGEVAYIIHRAEEVTEYVLKQKNARQAVDVSDASSRIVSDLFQRSHEIQDANFRLQNTMEALIKSQKDLKRSKEEAERANQLKSAFLANMSHEIRTPLGVMIGFADLITDTKIAPDDRKQYAQTLKRNGEQLSVLINDILDLSKVEAGHLKVEALEFSLGSLIEDVLSAMNVKAQEKGLRLTSRVGANTEDKLTSDPTRLRQILFNIVGNAVKFTQMGKVDLSVMHIDGHIEFEVCDSGIGIAPEHQSSLFKPFVQGDESMTRKFGGTGLGLALSKRLAQLLGGDLTLKDSIVGKGSTFKLVIKNHLPNVEGRKINPAAVENVIPEAVAALDGIYILLVEDSPDNQLLISRLLEKKGAKVEIAENGLEGVEKALNGKHHLVLMDVQMPVLDGYSATQRLRDAGFRKPIIALTAHAMSDVRKKCLDVGYTDYLPKPINPAKLVNTIAKYVASEFI
ncbi:MAG: PAS domain S-box protein [Bdellovibrio sp.]|nr:PAS domain S-box protein [Bdellovibrio sp.]